MAFRTVISVLDLNCLRFNINLAISIEYLKLNNTANIVINKDKNEFMRSLISMDLVQQLEFLLRLLLTIMTMNDEVKYPVIKPEDLPEEEWQELEDIWKRMEANVKASISNGEPLVKLTSYITDWSNLTDGSSDLDEQEDE